MRRTIVLAGNSPLLYFVALELNKLIARQVENNVIWLTTEKYLPDLAVNRNWSISQKKVVLTKNLENIKIVRSEVKSITLHERRIVSTRGVVDYDLLIIDQQPTYQFEELRSIKKAVNDLMLSVKALHNQAKPSTAKIVCKGDSAESLELACRISELIRTDFPRQIRSVRVDVPIIANERAAIAFMKANSLFETRSAEAELTLTLEPPKSYLVMDKIRGLKIGHKRIPIVEPDLQAKGKPGVIVVSNTHRSWQNLLHFQRSTARRIVKNIGALIEGQPTLPVEIGTKAYLLAANYSSFVELGDMVSNRTRARIIASMERRLLRRLQD